MKSGFFSLFLYSLHLKNLGKKVIPQGPLSCCKINTKINNDVNKCHKRILQTNFLYTLSINCSVIYHFFFVFSFSLECLCVEGMGE